MKKIIKYILITMLLLSIYAIFTGATHHIITFVILLLLLFTQKLNVTKTTN